MKEIVKVTIIIFLFIMLGEFMDGFRLGLFGNDKIGYAQILGTIAFYHYLILKK